MHAFSILRPFPSSGFSLPISQLTEILLDGTEPLPQNRRNLSPLRASLCLSYRVCHIRRSVLGLNHIEFPVLKRIRGDHVLVMFVP